MKDELEDFINQNRSAFDDQSPANHVWRNIDRSIGVQRSGWWHSVTVWRAAAAIFMALSIYLLIPKKVIPNSNSDVALKEFTDVEKFYVEQISEKVEMIDSFQKNEGLNGFTHDFQQLEAMYMVLKEEMHNHPTQKVKDALVLNLLVRIDLLNQQLHSLEKGYPKEAKKETSI
jgi:hypothetical protein